MQVCRLSGVHSSHLKIYWQDFPMPNWLIKSAVHRAISVLPQSHRWNALLQKITKSLELEQNRFEGKLNDCRLHLENFLEVHPGRTENFRALEVGTGWFATVPVGLFLCGAAEVWTFDIDPLLKSSRLKQMVDLILDYDQRSILHQHLPRVRADRIAKLRQLAPQLETETPAAFLDKLNIHVRVQDAQNTGLPAGSVDLFFSTSVLQYIPRPVLTGIFSEFKRLSSATAAMSHYLNLIDQFSYFDRSITPFNFLKYSPKQWNYLNSPLIWQNRLRISDYRELIAAAGFEITKELDTSGKEEDLKTIQLSPEFRHYTKKDLLVIISWIVAKPVLN